MRAAAFSAVVVFLVAAVGCSGGGNGDGGAGSSVAGSGVAGAAGALAGQGPGTSGEGAGGMNGTAGTTAGIDAADGGGVPAGKTDEHMACKIYTEAICIRRAQCIGSAVEEAECDQAAKDCPDTLFAPGSSRTIEGSIACAQEVMTFPCGALNANNVPDCLTAGTRKGGEDCKFSPQCESLRCNLDNPDPAKPQCGKCMELVPAGGDCSVTTSVCPVNESCDASKKCVPNIVDPLVDPPAHGKLGETCPLRLCEDGLVCLDMSSTATCQLPPGVGSPCGRLFGSADDPFSRVCDPKTAYCNTDDQCAAVPPLGAACAVTFSGAVIGGLPTACGENAYCDGMKCVPHASKGEACGSAGMTAGFSGFCVDGLECDPSTSQCAELLLEGEACGAPGTVCEAGTLCEGGTCTWQETGDLFEAACGP